jgi:hypothetical protein
MACRGTDCRHDSVSGEIQSSSHRATESKLQNKHVVLKKLSLVAVILSSCSYASANCENIFALAKTKSNTVTNKSSFETMAANFCKEYASSRQSGKAMNAGGSYGMFSAQVGMSNQSAEAVASKYCSAQDSSKSDQSAYQSYAETLAPQAFDAYNRCTAASEDVQYVVDSGILEREFAVSLGFRSGHTGVSSADIEVTASKGLQCSIGGSSVANFNLATGGTRTVKCERTDPRTDGYVRFVNRSSAARPVTFPWPASPSRPTEDAVAMLATRLAAAEQMLKQKRVESGEIVIRADGTRPMTDTSACPIGQDAHRGIRSGWQAFAQEFERPPQVHAGIAQIDSGIPANTGMRLAFNVQEVTAKGFKYSFVTWCNTSISGARAGWIAVLP